MVINTMRYRTSSPRGEVKQPRLLSEVQLARKEAELELKEYEAEQERIRIVQEVRCSVIRQKRQTLQLVKM